MKTCAHCGRTGRIEARFRPVGRSESVPLCHPREGLDCFTLVALYQEPLGARRPQGALDGMPAPIGEDRKPFHPWPTIGG
jgi:hypothetical protein